MKHLFSSFLALLIAFSSFAANFYADEEILIDQVEIGDIYIGGGEVIVSVPVYGDLVAGCGEINVEDTVFGDLLIGTGRAVINGYVSDDIRISAGEVEINNHVSGDLVVFGGSVRITENAEIIGDIICFAGEVNVYGNVGGTVKIYAGEVRLANEIGGDAEVKGGEIDMDGSIGGSAVFSAEEIEFGEGAQISGSLRYWSRDGEMDLSDYCSSVMFDDSLAIVKEEKDWTFLIGLLGFGIFAYWISFILAAFLILVLLEYLFSKYFNQAATTLKESFIKSFGYGMLYFLGVPVITIIAFVIVIGIPIGLLTLSFYLLSILFSSTIIGLTVSHYFRNRSSSDWSHMQTLGYALLTVVILKIIFFIPVLGQMIKTLVMASVFGAFLLLFFERQKNKSVEN